MQQMIKISDNPDIETLKYLVDLVNKNDLSTANNKVKNLTKKYPSSDVLHNISGLIAEKFNNFENAIYHYKSAIKIRPENVDSHFNLGNILKASSKLDEALYNLKKAKEHRMDPEKCLAVMGQVLLDQGKHHEGIINIRNGEGSIIFDLKDGFSKI